MRTLRAMGRSPRPQRPPHSSESGSPRRLGRREFLVVAGGAAAGLALEPVSAWARRLRPAATTLQPWALPVDPPPAGLDLVRGLIGAAVLAPSDWNTQPWRFEADPGSIRILVDPQRTLPRSDPDRRGAFVALGAALENLVVAARAWGLQPTVRYLPDAARGAVADVTWSDAGARRDRDLFGVIAERRTNRRNYDGRRPLPHVLAQLTAQVADGPRLYWLDDDDALRDLGRLVYEAVHAQVSDRKLQAEHQAWLRHDRRDAARRGDGVPVEALGLSGPANWFSGNYYDPTSWFLRFGAGSLAKRAREAVRSAGAAALLTVPARDESAWLVGGQAYERLVLKATQLGLAHQPLNAPIAVERFRARLLRRFGAPAEEPLMLVRFGRDQRVDHTPRRGVAMVASFRSA
jgi:hypothetical protein